MIELDPETHVYRVDGRVVPSVTEVLKVADLAPDYSQIDAEVLERAAARGVHVEQCCQLWSEGALEEKSVHPEAVGYVNAFKCCATQHQFDRMRWQVIGYDERCDVAGTTDIVCTIRNRSAVVDVKATSKLHRSYRLQLSAYRRMQLDVEHRYLLHLRRNGSYELKDCEAWARDEQTDDDEMWLAAVALYRWKHHGNGRK